MTFHKHIAIDLTDIHPGGENGGAKIFILSLIQKLAVLCPHYQFQLLTYERSHEELASLDADNVQRMCVLKANSRPDKNQMVQRILNKAKSILQKYDLYVPKLPKHFKADILICPFVKPYFTHLNIPILSIIYDLQYRYYPNYFEAKDWASRDERFRYACKKADKIVCISDFVKETIIEQGSILSEKIQTILIRTEHEKTLFSNDLLIQVMNQYNLSKGDYLFYPANFWEHKNHEVLFEALEQYNINNPAKKLKLVCTGAPSKRMEILKKLTKSRMINSEIIFPEFVTRDEFAVLMSECFALVFPSKYEGFGMPIVEAMVYDKPIICSNVTSLPEVAKDAALYFNPENPEEIQECLKLVRADKALVEKLKQKGQERLKTLGTIEDMSREYLSVIESLI